MNAEIIVLAAVVDITVHQYIHKRRRNEPNIVNTVANIIRLFANRLLDGAIKFIITVCIQECGM